jgi:hypothetical protein
MRGHEPLIAMRLRGVCPEIAFVEVGEDPIKQWRDWPVSTTFGMHAHIEISDRDRLSGLDLRFLTGMLVMVSGEDADRTFAVAQLVLDAGAKRVAATAIDPLTKRVTYGAYIEETRNEWQSF